MQADISIHRMGTLWKAVRASMTILDYLPPMHQMHTEPDAKAGDLLIDGGE